MSRVYSLGIVRADAAKVKRVYCSLQSGGETSRKALNRQLECRLVPTGRRVEGARWFFGKRSPKVERKHPFQCEGVAAKLDERVGQGPITGLAECRCSSVALGMEGRLWCDLSCFFVSS